MDRLKTIMRTGIVGIAVNALLAAFKLVVGTIAGSIAIMSDGINNLSDAASSLITMIGAALAGKPADRRHPFGYGRMEYLSSLVIAGLVLYAGVTSLVESVKKIIHPTVSEYTTLTLVIIIVAVVVKLFLALYTQAMGRKASSDALTASGKEAMLDVAVSASTVVAAFVYLYAGLSLEAYLGALISLVILKTGIELLRETISKILGEPAEVELAIAIKRTVTSFDEVQGAYDLVMNNYGPGFYMASIHVQVSEELKASELDRLTREITDRVLKEHCVYLAAIGFYSRNMQDPEALKMEEKIRDIVLNRENILSMHGFFVDLKQKKLFFDLVISLDAKNRREVYSQAIEAVKEVYPDYEYRVGFDMDFNELTI